MNIFSRIGHRLTRPRTAPSTDTPRCSITFGLPIKRHSIRRRILHAPDQTTMTLTEMRHYGVYREDTYVLVGYDLEDDDVIYRQVGADGDVMYLRLLPNPTKQQPKKWGETW